jgi:hypothetical protein
MPTFHMTKVAYYGFFSSIRHALGVDGSHYLRVW